MDGDLDWAYTATVSDQRSKGTFEARLVVRERGVTQKRCAQRTPNPKFLITTIFVL